MRGPRVLQGAAVLVACVALAVAGAAVTTDNDATGRGLDGGSDAGMYYWGPCDLPPFSAFAAAEWNRTEGVYWVTNYRLLDTRCVEGLYAAHVQADHFTGSHYDYTDTSVEVYRIDALAHEYGDDEFWPNMAEGCEPPDLGIGDTPVPSELVQGWC